MSIEVRGHVGRSGGASFEVAASDDDTMVVRLHEKRAIRMQPNGHQYEMTSPLDRKPGWCMIKLDRSGPKTLRLMEIGLEPNVCSFAPAGDYTLRGY